MLLCFHCMFDGFGRFIIPNNPTRVDEIAYTHTSFYLLCVLCSKCCPMCLFAVSGPAWSMIACNYIFKMLSLV